MKATICSKKKVKATTFNACEFLYVYVCVCVISLPCICVFIIPAHLTHLSKWITCMCPARLYLWFLIFAFLQFWLGRSVTGGICAILLEENQKPRLIKPQTKIHILCSVCSFFKFILCAADDDSQPCMHEVRGRYVVLICGRGGGQIQRSKCIKFRECEQNESY